MSDGYAVYDNIALANQLVRIACWAHCDRYLSDALQVLPKNGRGPDQLAAKFIAMIDNLYRVEAPAKEQMLGASALRISRQTHSVRVLHDVRALLLASILTVLLASLLRKALHYLSYRWANFERYAHSGHYPIDNSGCENSIRPFVIGRRN